jgi:hypothetical protein
MNNITVFPIKLSSGFQKKKRKTIYIRNMFIHTGIFGLTGFLFLIATMATDILTRNVYAIAIPKKSHSICTCLEPNLSIKLK